MIQKCCGCAPSLYRQKTCMVDMVKSDPRLHGVIVSFAGRIIGASADARAFACAADHGWLTPDGSVTADGRRLVDAHMDQAGAHSMFRHI